MKTFRRFGLLAPMFAVCLFCTGCDFSDANGGETVPTIDTGETDADPTIFKASSAPTATVTLPATVKASGSDAINVNATVRLPQLDEMPYSKPADVVASIAKPADPVRQKMGAAKPICNVYHNGDFGGEFWQWVASNDYRVPADFPVEFKLIPGYPDGFEQACGFDSRVSPTFHWATPRGYGRAYQGWFGADKFAAMYYRDADQPFAAPKPGSATASAPVPTDGKGCTCGVDCKCCPGCSCGGSHGPGTADKSPPMSAACLNGSCRIQTRGGKKQ